MVKTFKEGVENKLFPALESLATEEASKEVDFQELLRIFGFDMVCKVLIGFDPYGLDDYLADVSPLLKAFDVASEISAKRGAEPISAIWKIKRVFGIGSEKRLKNAVREIHFYLTNVIRDKKKENSYSKEKCNDLLSKMIMAGLEVVV